ncbi:MAG TPA: glucose 1-dehydrogenase [Bryobacteraceae bacterium]|nr:glucose 1-dehydrogenase [Bryobacteraceae bacterium]
MAKLTGKVAVVTGASKGIGAAIAEELAKDGASVIVNYSSSPQGAEAVVAKIKANGGKAKAAGADVSKPAEAKKLIDGAVAEFGRIDVLVNNAAVYDFAPLDQITEEHFDRMFDLNVRGLLFTTQAAAGAMGEQGGAIINIGSVASISAPPGGSVYSATKGAVDVITRSLASELGPRKILVNAVLPGPVETEGTQAKADWWDQFKAQIVPRTPLGRVGQPRDIATVVSFLASPEAGWITGQIIQTAGGLH